MSKCAYHAYSVLDDVSLLYGSMAHFFCCLENSDYYCPHEMTITITLKHFSACQWCIFVMALGSINTSTLFTQAYNHANSIHWLSSCCIDFLEVCLFIEGERLAPILGGEYLILAPALWRGTPTPLPLPLRRGTPSLSPWKGTCRPCPWIENKSPLLFEGEHLAPALLQGEHVIPALQWECLAPSPWLEHLVPALWMGTSCPFFLIENISCLPLEGERLTQSPWYKQTTSYCDKQDRVGKGCVCPAGRADPYPQAVTLLTSLTQFQRVYEYWPDIFMFLSIALPVRYLYTWIWGTIKLFWHVLKPK